MAERRLGSREVELMTALHELGQSNVAVARLLGVTEGAVRYRRKRAAAGQADGRRERASAVAAWRGAIEGWIETCAESRHRPALKALHGLLREYHGYDRSYDALRRWVRKSYPELLKKGARLRLETPPGVLAQVDWKEDVAVQLGRPGGWCRIQVFVLELAFSRKVVVRVSGTKELSAFVHCHQEAFRQLGGLPGWIRPDCLKTAVSRWRGTESVLTEGYRRYLGELGIRVCPSRPGTPTDKGKVEKRIRDLFGRVDLAGRVFPCLADVQQHLDRAVAALEQEWRSGATGLDVAASFTYERAQLRPLPAVFPDLPVKERRTQVSRDGTVYFDGNYYQVPDECRGHTVLCVHAGQEIRIYRAGEVVVRQPHLPGARGMVRLWPAAIGASRIPLSETVRAWGLEVAARQVAIYEAAAQGGGA